MDDTNFTYSASSLKSMDTCGYKFYLSKVAKLERTDTSSHHSFLGLVVHNAIYTAFATYGEDKKSWTLLNDAPDFMRSYDFFDAAWSENPVTDEFKYIIDNDVSKKPDAFWKKLKIDTLSSTDNEQLEDSWREHANTMMLNGVDMIADVNIVELEREVRFTLMGKNFLGFIDILAKDKDGKLCFYDLKTSWDKPTAGKLSKDLQFILYSAALKQLHNLDYYPKGYWCHLKTKEFVEFEMTTEIRRDSSHKLQKLFDMIGNNDFIKATHLKTSLCPYCEYFTHCYGEKYTAVARKSFLNDESNPLE